MTREKENGMLIPYSNKYIDYRRRRRGRGDHGI
jgi:hypothetical protein